MTYLKHPITHVMSEGLNPKIQTIKKIVCSFRNRETIKIAICFHSDALNSYPPL